MIPLVRRSGSLLSSGTLYSVCPPAHSNCAGSFRLLTHKFSLSRGCHGSRTNPDIAASAIHNIQSITSKWSEKFAEMKIPEPAVSAELIVAHALGKKTLSGVAPWQIVSIEKTNKIHTLCAQRLLRKPVQYVIEEWDFRDLVLQLKPPVLIPRPETEDLITHITNYIRIHDINPPTRILDIGCGSGAIALSLAREYPSSTCVAIDRCDVACELTSKNANNYALSNVYVEKLELSDLSVKVNSYLQMWDFVLEHRLFKSPFDLIVSNPPYLRTEALASLPPEISKYEDVDGALHGGVDGLDIIRIILRNCHHFMHKDSLVWLEADSDHPEALRKLTMDNPSWKIKSLKAYKDFLDKPRFCLFSHVDQDTSL